MRTDVRWMMAGWCVVWTALAACGGCGAGAGEASRPAAEASQVEDLAAWARTVRTAAADRRAALVRERFDASVSEAHREAWSASIAASLVQAEAPEPVSATAVGRGAVRAMWRCRAAGGTGATLVLLFRGGAGEPLRLLGPML